MSMDGGLGEMGGIDEVTLNSKGGSRRRCFISKAFSYEVGYGKLMLRLRGKN